MDNWNKQFYPGINKKYPSYLPLVSTGIKVLPLVLVLQLVTKRSTISINGKNYSITAFKYPTTGVVNINNTNSHS